MPGCTCQGCTESRGEFRDVATCENCGDDFDRHYSNSYYRCNSCDESEECEGCGYSECQCCYDCECHPCACGNGGGEYVRNYSWLPDLLFRDAGEDDPDADRLHFGWELEVPSTQSGELAEAIYEGVGEQEQILYCKEDGSISGVEIVSHPMTHAYFRTAPFHAMFQRRSTYTSMLNGEPGNGYGLHVHVSRKGFASEAHTLRWLLLVYRNQEQMSLLARRESAEWSSFDDANACVAKAKNTQRVDPAERAYQIERYGYDPFVGQTYNGPRYAAVNANNRHTFEVRLFKSTWNEQEFRSAVDFCHASVKYTEKLTAGEALRGGLSWESFRAWVADRPEYTALTAELTNIAAA